MVGILEWLGAWAAATGMSPADTAYQMWMLQMFGPDVERAFIPVECMP